MRGRSISGTTSGPIGPTLRRSHHSAENAPPPSRKTATIHGHHDPAGFSSALALGVGKLGNGAAGAGAGVALTPGATEGSAIGGVVEGAPPPGAVAVGWGAGAVALGVAGDLGVTTLGTAIRGTGAGVEVTMAGPGAGAGVVDRGAGVGAGRGAGVSGSGPITCGVGVGAGCRRKSDTCAAAGAATG